MELFLLIVRNVFIAIAILYLLVVIVDVSFVGSFRSIMKHHAHDITVILTNKRDLLIKLIDFANSLGIKLDKKNTEAVRNYDVQRIIEHDGEDAKKAREELTSLCDYFVSETSQIDVLNSQSEYQKIIENINELEKVYRQHLMMYNADVLGYNFWIYFWPTRYIYKIIKFKKKDNI